MQRSDSGVLIAVEGIDGAGKSTQVTRLCDVLRAAGRQVVQSREPTDGPWGRKIRQSAATQRMSLEDELHAFVEDRKEHVRDLILPALAAGKTVLLDRYFYSTIAYQGARGADIADLTEHMLDIAPEPNLVLLLDVPPEKGLAQIAQGRQQTPDQFETAAYLARVREIFLHLAETRPNIRLVDGAQTADEVHQAIVRHVNDVLNFRLNSKKRLLLWIRNLARDVLNLPRFSS